MTSSVPAVQAAGHDSAGLQAVLLDMDGTLVDTEGFWWQAESDVFAGLGHVLDEKHRQIVIGGPMTRSVGHLISVTGVALGIAELSTLINARFVEIIGHGVPLMPGARRLLAELAAHRVPTALVSASHREIIDIVLKSLGPENFALSVAGDELDRTKPHPEPYLRAAAGLGADPARCVVVEDTVTGVASAEAAGCRVVAVPSLVTIEPAPGRTVVDSLERVDLAFLRHLAAAGR
ncbi:HAD family phosphatase [Streptomyces sp. SL13]|uniref:HAD family phosphatase n=1 Tax=Streptantibioticus silvisoli TaxID=2705255 RepID=A0AA90H9E5_9ACTN|nr:HAD family phosphatase [Streptantibioticus silvisoli]MDI5967598.1 HAD family phosphatase [Streptantibioticus silvisoli]MDI5974286.1 HAD family phosphatase [Streptantibioticus silvisoli]